MAAAAAAAAAAANNCCQALPSPASSGFQATCSSWSTFPSPQPLFPPDSTAVLFCGADASLQGFQSFKGFLGFLILEATRCTNPMALEPGLARRSTAATSSRAAFKKPSCRRASALSCRAWMLWGWRVRHSIMISSASVDLLNRSRQCAFCSCAFRLDGSAAAPPCWSRLFGTQAAEDLAFLHQDMCNEVSMSVLP